MVNPVRAELEARIAEREAALEHTRQGEEGYSPALFVLRRLLEFPFERYPAYCYPGHLVTWPHMRWHQVEQVIRFCEHLLQPKGSRAGRPVRLLGFQVLIIACILGPEDPDTGLRVARDVVMTIGRKNGKTALIGMLFLAILSLDAFDFRAQEVQIGASDREQAGKTFQIVQNLILLDRTLGLESLYHVVPSKKKITHKKTFSQIECLSSDAYRAHGANPAAVLLDELGNLPDNRARDFYGVLSTAFGSQLEPLLLMFSTQAPTDSHLFSEFVDRAKQCNRDRRVDDGLVGFIFDLPKEDDGTGLVCLEENGKATETVDHFAEENWARPNPALEGVEKHGFRLLKDMRHKAKEARDMPSLENNFRNLQLNQRITAHSPFISQAAWERCLTDPIDEEFLEPAECFAAGDLATTTDLASLVAVWRLESGKFYARVIAYTPEEGLEERANTSKVPYDLWVRQGHLKATPGRTIDYAFIATDLKELDDRYLLARVGFDRYKWDQVRRECLALDWEPYEAEPGDFWVPIGQGFIGMGPCVDALEKLILDRRILIERNPVATWAASNAVTVADPAANRKFERTKSYGKIDPIVALAMAARLASEGELDERAGEGRSVYEDEGRGLIIL